MYFYFFDYVLTSTPSPQTQFTPSPVFPSPSHGPISFFITQNGAESYQNLENSTIQGENWLWNGSQLIDWIYSKCHGTDKLIEWLIDWLRPMMPRVLHLSIYISLYFVMFFIFTFFESYWSHLFLGLFFIVFLWLFYCFFYCFFHCFFIVFWIFFIFRSLPQNFVQDKINEAWAKSAQQFGSAAVSSSVFQAPTGFPTLQFGSPGSQSDMAAGTNPASLDIAKSAFTLEDFSKSLSQQ